MSIEMSAPELTALAGTLREAAGTAAVAAARLDRAGDVGDVLQPAVEAFLDGHRTAGRALAGELTWLGDTVAAVAASWLDLDRGLLASRGRAGAR
jgi:hypothetical protein